MKNPSDADVRKAASILAKKGAKIGGLKRWEGKTAQEKRDHALLMVEARRKKKVENKP